MHQKAAEYSSSQKLDVGSPDPESLVKDNVRLGNGQRSLFLHVQPREMLKHTTAIPAGGEAPVLHCRELF